MIQESQLGNHLDFRNGKSSPPRDDAGRYSVFGSNGVIGRADQCNAGAQTIIVGRVGTYCGSIHFSSDPCWVTDNAIVASAKKPEEARFWHLFLRAYDLNNHRSGSGQPLLNQSILNSLKIRIPSESARLSIAYVLCALDDKIELNRQMNETLAAMARAIFKDWFVDFGPTRAKMEARAPYLAAISGRYFRLPLMKSISLLDGARGLFLNSLRSLVVGLPRRPLMNIGTVAFLGFRSSIRHQMEAVLFMRLKNT